jgi:putative hydrolase of the HAD superfamily
MPDPNVLLFDLGYVLVDVVWVDDLMEMLAEAPSRKETEARYHTLECYLAFEAGELTAAQFGEAFHAAWPLKVTPAEFTERFSLWVTGPYPGVAELLETLGRRFRLAALSNSNELHWATVRDLVGPAGPFERAFASHQARMRNPDAAFYLHAARELGVQPSDICFFDDRLDNVEAARAVGMQAHQVCGVEELRACLTRLGYLDGAASS